MEWYYAGDADEEIGPVDDATIQAMAASGGITRKTMVWCEGMEDWKAACKTNLAKYFPTIPPPLKPMPLPPQPVAKSSRKFGWTEYIIVAVVIIVLAVIALSIGVPPAIVTPLVAVSALFMQNVIAENKKK